MIHRHTGSLYRAYVLIAALVAVGCGLLVFVRWQLPLRNAQTVAHLERVKQQVMDEVTAFFNQDKKQVLGLLASVPFRTLCARVVQAQSQQSDLLHKQIADAIPQAFTTAWKDMLFVCQGQVRFSLRGFIPVGTATEAIPALDQIQKDAAYVLSSWRGEFDLMPGTKTPLLFAVYPCVHDKQFIGTLVTVLDHENISSIIARHFADVGPQGDIIVARDNKVGTDVPDTGIVLFNTQHDLHAAFTQRFSLKIPSPIAYANTGKFGSSIEKFGNKLIASVRDLWILERWGIAVVQDVTMRARAFEIIHTIALLLLGLALLLAIALIALHRHEVIAFIRRESHHIILACVGLWIFGTLYGCLHYVQQAEYAQQLAKDAAIAQAKTDVQSLTTLFIRRSYEIQAMVDAVVRQGTALQAQVLAGMPDGVVLGSSVLSQDKWQSRYVVAGQASEQTTLDVVWVTKPEGKGFWKPVGTQRIPGKEIFIIYAKPTHDGYVWGGVTFEFLRRTLAAGGRERVKHMLVFDSEGTVVFHPNAQYMTHKVSVRDVIGSLNGAFDTVEKRSRAGYSGIAKADDQGQVVIYEAIPGVQWTVAVVYQERDFFVFTYPLFRALLLCLILFIMWLIGCAAMFVRLYEGSLESLHLLSPIYSVLSIVLIIVLITLNNRYYDKQFTDHPLISSQAAIDQLQDNALITTGTEPVVIKMGMRLTYLDIVTPNKIEFNALVWQSIDRALAPDTPLGFLVENASGDVSIRLLSTKRQGSIETAQWDVKGKIYQVHPRYATVPFDVQTISWRFVPTQLGRPVLFVPDLAAYPSESPASLPGVDPIFSMKDLVIVKSVFSNVGTATDPVFSYMVVVKRNLLSILLQYLLPLFIMLITIYMLSLMTATENLNRLRLAMITATSGLFFGLILLHQSYRTAHVIPGVSYLEWFIVGVYVALGYSYINLLFWLDKEESRKYKLVLYWPIFITYLLAITIVSFVH